MLKEISVEGVFSGENVTENEVATAIAKLAESEGWVFGGGVKDITDDLDEVIVSIDKT